MQLVNLVLQNSTLRYTKRKSPFAFLDIIGPNTPYNLFHAWGEQGDELSAKVAGWLKSEYLDKGRMGTANGKGVYTYPNPAYHDPDFIKK